MDERAAREKLDALCLRYQRYEGFLRFLAEQAKANGLFDKYEQKLTALYLRVLQGPIRMAIVGESSAGKSTLINAFAGDFVAPENAGVCTSQLTYLLRHEEENTYVNPYTSTAGDLPAVRSVWNTEKLLTRQHGAKAEAAQTGAQDVYPFVYANGRMMPRGVTFVDTPGLNAAGADTQTTLGLFSAPPYADDGARDLPEMLLYMTKGHNLLQTESSALVRLRGLGVDLDNCIVVHNDVREAYLVLVDTFEEVSSGAVEGLQKSLAAIRRGETAADGGAEAPVLLTDEAPESGAPADEAPEDDDPWDFDAFLEGDDEDEDEPQDEVFSVNALLARMMYVETNKGLYNVFKYLPDGMTIEERESWKALENKNTTQSELARVRDQWVAQGHSGYAPMQALRDAIERRALRLAGQGGLSDVLDAADALAHEILSDCSAAIDASAGPVPRDELDALADLIRRAKGVLFAFSAEEGAFAKGVESVCIAPKAAAALHNSKIELTLKSFAGQKFNLVDLGALVVGNFFAPALLIPLARYLLRDDLPKRYGKLLKDKGLGGRDLDALFDGEPTLAGVGALVQIISDLAAKLSDELWPTAEQMQGIAGKGVDACRQAVADANKEMIMIESEFIGLMKLPKGRALRTEMTAFDGERATKALAERIAYLHPELELPEQDELGSRVRGLMHKLKNSGAVTMFNAKDRVYKEIISVVLREAVEALRMPEDQPDCGAVQMIDSLAKPVVTAWKDLLEEMTRAYDGRERILREREEAQAQQLAARKGELAARFDSERPA